MAHERIELELPHDLAAELSQLARSYGIAMADAAIMAIGDWVSRHRDETANENSAQKYFVNEALDELIGKKER